MSSDRIWSFFEETGDIEYYLIYKELSALDEEKEEECDNSSAG